MVVEVEREKARKKRRRREGGQREREGEGEGEGERSEKKFPNPGKNHYEKSGERLNSMRTRKAHTYNFGCTWKDTQNMKKEEKQKHDRTYNHYRTLFTACGVEWDAWKWVLHHIDPTMKYRDPARYHEWRIDDVSPLTVEQHLRLHMTLRNPKGTKKTKKHIENMKNGHRKERWECNVMIHRVVEKDGVEGIEAYVFPSCAEAARHIGCSLQMVYQVASKTQKNRRAKGWFCDYVPSSVSIGKVAADAFDKIRALVA